MLATESPALSITKRSIQHKPDSQLFAPLTGRERAMESINYIAPQSGSAVKFVGPQQWWSGPLNTEELVRQSVGNCAASLAALTGASSPLRIDVSRAAHSFNSYGLLRINGKETEGFAPLSGFFPTSTGWVRTHANYPHHRERLLKAFNVHSGENLAAALLETTSLEAERWGRAQGAVLTAVRTRDEWLAHPQGRSTNNKPWIQFASKSSPTAHAWRPHSVALPLHGLKILDFTRVIAGPTATRLLGALGADVLRIDPPHMPEDHTTYLDMGFSKRSAVADLRDPQYRKQVHELASEADVIVGGYRPGALERYGCGVSQLTDQFPGVIGMQLSAWETSGPWGFQAGFDSIVQAACGIATLLANPTTQRPGALPVQALDYATGYAIASAILHMLHQNRQGHALNFASVSLQRTADVLFNLKAEQPGKTGKLAAPLLSEYHTSEDTLEAVALPFDIDNSPLPHRFPPRRYATAKLEW